MVAVSKADRFIKVSNLPQDISNDVLGFIFSESVNVERTPSATTAIVEFGSVRDAENYIRKDKTLMIENKVLGIEGFSAKNEGPSNDDPLKCRQLFIENLPRSTTTEYLDVLFPFAKSIKHLDACSAIAEYRTAKDAERELLKSKSLRIDRHKLFVRLAKDCHRFGGIGGEHDLHEKGHPSKVTTDRSSVSNANKSDLKKSTSGKDDFLFAGDDIPSDLYGLPAEFGRGSHSRQRKDDKQTDSFKRPLGKSLKKGILSNRTSAKAAPSSSGKAKGGGLESKTAKGSDKLKPRLSGAAGSQKPPNRAKPHTSSFGGNKTLDQTKNPDVLPGTSSSSNHPPHRKNKIKIRRTQIFDRSKYTWVDSKVYGSTNQKPDQPIPKTEEHHKREGHDDWTRETQAREGEDKRNVEQNRRRMVRARSDERERPEFKRRILPDDATWREIKITNRGRPRASRRASCERFDAPIDDYEKPQYPSTRYSLDKRSVHRSERGSYRDQSEYNSESSPDRIVSSYKDTEFSRAALDLENFRNRSDFDERMPDRTVVREGRRADWGERENKVPFPPRIYQNLKWNITDSKTDPEGQSKKPPAEHSRTYDKDLIMDRKRFNGEPNMNQDGRKRYQDQYGQSLNRDQDEGAHIDKDRSSRGSVSIKRKFDHSKNVDDPVLDPETSRRRIDRGSTMDQRILDIVSNINNDRFNRNQSMDKGRFAKDSNMDRERFAEDLNRDQGKFDWARNMDRERYDRGSDIDHRKFDKGSNIDREMFDMDRERFDRKSDRDPERFDRSSGVSQSGFVKSSNSDQSRLDVNSDIDREAFHRGSNMNSGRFGRNSKMEHEIFDRAADTDMRRINRGSNIDAGRFERNSNLEQEVFDQGSHIDCQRSAVNQRMSNNSSNMDRDIRFNEDRFTRNVIRDQEILNESNRSHNKWDRDFRIDQGRFDSGSNVKLDRFEKGPTVDQNLFRSHSKQDQSSNPDPNRFNRIPHMDQGRFEKGSTVDQSLFGNHSKQDQSSNPDPNRFNRVPHMDQGRFEKGSTVDQSLFGSHSKQDHSSNPDPNRFNRVSHMDQGRFEKGSTVDQSLFDSRSKQNQSSHTDPNRFSRAPMDHGRFDRGSNIFQGEFERDPDMVKGGGFDRYQNVDRNRFARDQNLNQERPGMGPNIDQTRFSKGSDTDQNRSDRYSNQDQNRFHVGQNRDQSKFNSSVNRNPDRFAQGSNSKQDRFDQGLNSKHDRFDQGLNSKHDRFDQGQNIDHHSTNRDKSGFGNNFNNQWPNTTWKSDKFARNDAKIGVNYKSDVNTDSKQCWGEPAVDNNMQNRRDVLQGRHFESMSHPEKRTCSNIQADDQWKTNMAARNFRHESREENCQEFPNKRPRKEVGYNNEDDYFSTGHNRPHGQNSLMMNSYHSHTSAHHLQPLSLSSSRLPVMQSSLTSNTSQHHLASSNRL